MSSLVWALPLVPLFAGCGALDDFETQIEDQATIPGTFGTGMPGTLDFGGSFDSLQLSSNREFDNRGVDPSDVDAIFVKSVRVESTEPMRDRLDVLIDEITLVIEAPGLDSRTLASKSELPMGPSVELDVDPTFNLKPYAVASSMSISATLTLKQQPTFTTTLRTIVTLAIDVNLLGV
ncbi:MAG: hypothetical protein HYV07_25920 [Deltaproteobacteria bacterium]|nr:hypothetical protein [Deltaproteobacteria bacterium]